MIGFDEQFAAQTPQEFIDHVLVERLRATHVSVGENFRFGHGAAGDTDMLGADPRFETRVVRWSRSTARSCPPATSGRWCRPATSSTPPGFWARPFSCAARW